MKTEICKHDVIDEIMLLAERKKSARYRRFKSNKNKKGN